MQAQDGLCAVVGAEFAEDVLEVPFHRIGGDRQGLADFPVGHAVAQKAGDIGLTRAEIGEARGSCRGDGWRGLHQAGDELASLGLVIAPAGDARAGIGQHLLQGGGLLDQGAKGAAAHREGDRFGNGFEGGWRVAAVQRGNRGHGADLGIAAEPAVAFLAGGEGTQQRQGGVGAVFGHQNAGHREVFKLARRALRQIGGQPAFGDAARGEDHAGIAHLTACQQQFDPLVQGARKEPAVVIAQALSLGSLQRCEGGVDVAVGCGETGGEELAAHVVDDEAAFLDHRAMLDQQVLGGGEVIAFIKDFGLEYPDHRGAVGAGAVRRTGKLGGARQVGQGAGQIARRFVDQAEDEIGIGDAKGR